MEPFAAIYERAARRHGGPQALEARLSEPKSRAALRRIPDHRILAEMTRQVFNAGFVWRVIEAKWPRLATRDNARFLVELAKEHGSAARWLADWPESDIVGLWGELARRGSRLGGFTGQMFLRHLGKDTPMLTGDVIAALRRAGVVTAKSPTSKRALAEIQAALEAWRTESGRSLTEISRVLACSEGEVRRDPEHAP